jgi:phage-related protein
MWSVETLSGAVDAEIERLPVDLRARLARVGQLLEAVGFDGLPADTVKHLEDKLWELRLRGRDGIARAIYVTAVRRRVVILRVFVKKSQKTPLKELELARQRAKEAQ